MPTTIHDAQANLGFVLSQTSHIERAVNETRYPDIQYQMLVPVDTTAHPFAKTVTYFSSDMFGGANWINGNANGVPLVGVEQAKHDTAVHMAGVGYGYGFEDIEHARMLGISLDAMNAKAARRAYEEFVDEVALRGDASKGFTGLYNNASVSVRSATNGDWGNAATTEDEILRDVNDALLAVNTDTKFTSVADTLLLPYEAMNTLATRRLGDTTMTVLEFIRKNNTYTAMTGRPLTIRAVRGLETAGASGVRRMVAYRRSDDVVKLHIPMPHRFLPAFAPSPLRVEIPGVFRLGGTDVRRPKEMNYVDGI